MDLSTPVEADSALEARTPVVDKGKEGPTEDRESAVGLDTMKAVD